MAQIASTSLESRIEELEAFARSWSAGNITSRAAVVNAAGRYVPLDQLAFGLVSATDPAYTEILGGNPVSGPGGLGWFYGSPQLDVLVNGGGLLVLTAARLHSQGNKTSMYQSYRLIGPSAAPSATGAVPVDAAYDRAIEVFDLGVGQGVDLGVGSFGVHTGLAAGWYRVQTAYALSWSGTQFTIGSATNRRVAALPF